MTLKISISGVRGFVPASLTPEVCLDFAKAFGTYLKGGKVVIGTDSRRSSEFIKGIVFSGLLACGCKVVDLGICPTPTVGIMLRKLKADGGMVITASHNPLPWNGLKFMREDGIFLNEEQAKKLLQLYENKNFKPAAGGSVTLDPSGIKTHIQKVLGAIHPLALRFRKLKVAVDCCNGAGSVALPEMLKRIGCKVFTINCNPRFPFPHPPEPIEENLRELSQFVLGKKADIGFAVDSDADRLAIVSEEGKPIGEELTLTLAVKYLLSKKFSLRSNKKIVITNLSTTMALDAVCRQHGATLLRTKIGEVHVAEELKNLKGLIGGEGNGGVIFPRIGFNRDSLGAAVLILNYMASSGQKLSQLAADLPPFEMVKSKIECRTLAEASDYLEKVKGLFKGCDLILTDGVKILLPDAWVHVRASNTEPVLRIIAEAKDKKKAEELIRKVSA